MASLYAARAAGSGVELADADGGCVTVVPVDPLGVAVALHAASTAAPSSAEKGA